LLRYPSAFVISATPVRRILPHVPAALAIAVVLAAYAWFGGGASFSFPRIGWEDSYYASLAEGFFRGHLYMAYQPDPRLMALPFPYDYKAREGKVDYVWDASYFNGHYYLYFSPLPALIFYMPYRLLRGGYPRDALAAAVFAAWALLASAAFVRRALALTGRRPGIPLPLWILMIGFGNVALFHLMDIRVYEVAILAGSATSATWAYALVRYIGAPSVRRAVWLGVWLALSVAVRPNLLVLLLVTVFVMWYGFSTRPPPEGRPLRGRGRVENPSHIVAAAIPLAVVAALLLGYNYARFGQLFESGHTYQLTFVPMEGKRVCSLCTLGEASRFINTAIEYVFWAPSIRAQFPWVDLQYASPDPVTSFPMPGPEQVVGIAPLVPLTMLGTLFAALFALRRGPLDNGTRAGTLLMFAAWLVLLGLSTCWWIVSRYSLDFMFLMTAATAVCIESGLGWLESIGVRMLPLRVAVIALTCYTIALGFLLGFGGQQNSAFKRLHPQTFEKFERIFR